MSVSFLQKSLGGKLTHTVVDLSATGGRWDASTAPTCTLYDRGGGAITSTRTADLGPTTTLSSAAAAGQKTLSINTTSSLVRWEDYVVGPNASGQWEWVTVDAITATSVTVLENLQHAYSSTNVFKSHDMSLTLTSGDVGTIARDCRAQWAYDVDGISRTDQTIFHVSLYAPRMALTPADVVQEYPRVHKVIADQQRIGVLLRRMWRTRVLADLGRIWVPGALISGEMANEALLYRTVAHVARQARDMEGADMWMELYRSAIDSVKSALDLDESGGIGDDETPRGVATPRILRG